MVMSNFGACFRICSTHPTPAIPLPTTTSFSMVRTPSPLAWRNLLYAYGALLVIRLARNRIKRALRDLVGVGFHKMKRHEDLSGRDDLCHAKFHLAHPSPPRAHVHA